MSFVGIGMGAIQAGLFLPRAQEANVPRTVLVRRPEQARTIDAAGELTINVARADGIYREVIEDMSAMTLNDEGALGVLVAAEHISVAVSSVADYASFAPLLSQAITLKARGEGPKSIFYTSENDLDAAAQLEASIGASPSQAMFFQIVDTVIGKMSRTVRDQDEVDALDLARGASGLPEAWLVEAYDDIYMSSPDDERTPGKPLPRLLCYDDLMPFEQAKLNGHNAAHASLAYIGRLTGLPCISDVLENEAAYELVFGAFMDETGYALIKRYEGYVPLFTNKGWCAHAVDLFERMANPWLRDDCDRVGRDTVRKLGWNDRLVGTIRMIETEGLKSLRWRIALHIAMDASGVALETLVQHWRSTNAPPAQVLEFARSVENSRSAYDDWRKQLDLAAAD